MENKLINSYAVIFQIEFAEECLLVVLLYFAMLGVVSYICT